MVDFERIVMAGSYRLPEAPAVELGAPYEAAAPADVMAITIWSIGAAEGATWPLMLSPVTSLRGAPESKSSHPRSNVFENKIRRALAATKPAALKFGPQLALPAIIKYGRRR